MVILLGRDSYNYNKFYLLIFIKCVRNDVSCYVIRDKCKKTQLLQTDRELAAHIMKTFIRHIGRKHREIEYKN